MVHYLAGATAARTGDEMSGPALLLVGLAVTRDTSTASTLLAALTMSAALGGPCFGVVLDRSDHPARVLAATLILYAAGLLVVLTTLGHAPTLIVIGIAALTGLGNPALAGAWTAQLPAVRTDGHLGRANTLDALTFNAASLAGPALAGLLASELGAAEALAVAIGLVSVAAPTAAALPRTTRIGSPTPRASPAADLLSGFTALVGNRNLLRATATSTVSYIGVGMFVVCCPLLGERHLGDTSKGAVLLSILAATGLLANAALARAPARSSRDRTLVISTGLMAGGTLLAAVSGSLPGGALGVAMIGVGEGPALTALFAVRHREAPTGARAQIFTTGASLKITGFAIGLALAGPIATWSLTGCLLTAAGIQLLATLVYLACSVKTPVPAHAA